ncbi:hypothetical protein [Vibrio harveyi]|uniref:hypothetical protein n=1 Tax=Vibrio harveyi TaxID=669 RepID=UPI003BB4E285
MKIKATVTHHIISSDSFASYPYSLASIYKDSKGIERVLDSYWLYEDENHKTVPEALDFFTIPVKVVSIDEYNTEIKTYNRRYHTKAEPITKQRFEDMLNTLPPMRWHSVGAYEVFCFTEAYHDTVYRWFARSNNLAFEFKHDRDATDKELLEALPLI